MSEAAGTTSRVRFPATAGTRQWVVSLAALTAVTALSIDLSLPVQPTLAVALRASSSAVQLTLSLFLLGFALGQLVVGPLSDALGRRPVLLAGLALFTIAGLASSVAPNIESVVAARFIQGMGAAVGAVIGRAMVRDTHDARAAARHLATMTAVLAVAPMTAPLLGSAIGEALGWRAVFGALSIFGALFFALSLLTLEETLPVTRRTAPEGKALLAGFARFFRTRGTTSPLLYTCLSFTGQFAFISASPFVLIEGKGQSPVAYALWFGSAALSLMLGASLSSRLLGAGRMPIDTWSAGAAVMCTGALSLVAGVHVDDGVVVFMVPIFVLFFGIGLGGPSATALAMEPVKEIAGTASAIVGCVPMACGALSGFWITRHDAADGRRVGVFVAVTATLALVTALLVRRGRAR